MENFPDPQILRDYLDYLKTIKGLSKATIKEYAYDLRVFIRFEIIRKLYFGDFDKYKKNFKPEKVDKYVNPKFIDNLTIQDLYSYLSYLDNDRSDSSSTRSRKISAIKSFYSYLYTEVEVIDKNLANRLTNPKIQKRQPVYLTLDETQRLLSIVSLEKNEFLRARDLSIILTFLTTGMRLSELVSINVDDIKSNSDSFKIIGKGNKERTIYLTKNCKSMILSYMKVRKVYLGDLANTTPALFVSTHKKRMSNRSVQATVDKYLKKAGFDTSIYSTHKLRHTAATLMYKYGNVDIRALKDILGHESVATTQIYTHVDDADLQRAVNKNPLSTLKLEDLK